MLSKRQDVRVALAQSVSWPLISTTLEEADVEEEPAGRTETEVSLKRPLIA